MPPVFIGVFFHWLGGLASGSFYVPYRFVKNWSWEVYWLAGGVMSWIIAPWLLALVLSNNVFETVWATWQIDPQAIIRAFLFGMMWGVGGLTFGLTMRYLGMSLGMAVALGYCTVFGSLMPPIVKGEFMTQILGSDAGLVNLFGLGVCALGIILAGLAGMSKEREMSEEAKKASIKEFSFTKGILVATFSGIFSAGMAYGLAAAEPVAVSSTYFGTAELWSGLPKLCVILAGGFTSNFIWCMILLLKNKTLYQYTAAVMDEKKSDGTVEKVRVPMFANYFFSMLAGLTWYLQFFFYSMGETKMGDFKFSSWTLHMASIIIFSSLWGIALKEWKGSSRFTKSILAIAIGTLIYSTLVVGYSNLMNAHSESIQTKLTKYEAPVYIGKDGKPAAKTVEGVKEKVGELVVTRTLSANEYEPESNKMTTKSDQKKGVDQEKARIIKELEKRYPKASESKTADKK